MSATAQLPDVFAQAKACYDVLSMWIALGIPGEAKLGMNLSPFRDESRPSFSIFQGGQRWKDHGGEGGGGDCLELAKVYHGFTGPELREFLLERLGIDHLDPPEPRKKTPPKAPEPPKEIQWPGELVTGSEATWEAFARLRGLTYAGVWTMVHAGVLRFGIVDGHRCFIVTDDQRRAAEIRRIDGGTFSNDRKAYPLPGVDKSWLVGADLIAESPGHGWAISEGASDFLDLFDLYVRYRRSGGQWRFLPMAMLGAGVKRLDPAIMEEARDRTIILIPDGDEAGDGMKAHWVNDFTNAGADVEVFCLPRGKDLRDVAGEIQPEDLFDE